MTNRFICVKAVGIFMKNVNGNHAEMYMLNIATTLAGSIMIFSSSLRIILPLLFWDGLFDINNLTTL